MSCEPLLSDLREMDLTDIDWVIVGGESGPNSREIKVEWVTEIRDLFKKKEVPFFFKQWGTWGADKVKRNKKLNGKEIDGKIWQQYPEVIEQQFAVA